MTRCGSPTTASTDSRARSTGQTSPRRRRWRAGIRSGAVNVNTVDVQRLRAERGVQAERPGPRARRGRASGPSRRSSICASANCRPELRTRSVTMTSRPESLDWLISVDDHILEPPHLWVDRVAAKDRDRAPHMETVDGMEYWVYDGKRYPEFRAQRSGGKVEGGVQPRAGDLRRDAPRLLRRQGPPRGHGPGRDPRLAVLPDASPGSAASSSWRPATASSGSSACRPTTTGSSRSGAGRRQVATSR